MKAISARTMRELDEQTIESGTSGEELMERAGRGAFHELLAFVELLDSRHAIQFVIVTGKGNNGGDGHVVARCLADYTDYPVSVFSTVPKSELKGDALTNAEDLPETVEFQVGEALPDDLLVPGVVLVDALLGTGISGEVREPYAHLIRQMNDSGLPIVALDNPSGLDATAGTITNTAIMADLTITMGLPKIGLFRGDGLLHSGRLRLVEIGIPESFIRNRPSPFDAIFAQDVRPLLGRLPKDVHKGNMGRILIVGGARMYPGAPMLTGHGALRAGGGLVSVAYPGSIAYLLRPPCNSLILHPIADNDTGIHQPGQLSDLAADQDVLLIGPGLSRESPALEAAAELLRTDKPAVLDADGLQVIGHAPDLFPRQATTVITPHPGEMKRILQALDMEDLAGQDRLVQANKVAQRLDAYVVLKGAATVISAPDARLAVNSSGCPALASGGSGDVLTGIIGAFLARSQEPWEAIMAAVFLHGLAAELGLRGQRNLIADDLPELLGDAMQLISPFA